MIKHSEILQLCRLCLVKEKVNHSIFEESGDLLGILLKITSCLPVSISQDDSLPKRICETCYTKLDSYYKFWNDSANAEKKLLQWLSQTTLGTISKTGQGDLNKSRMDKAIIKEETIDLEDGKLDSLEMSTDAKTYILQQQQLPYSVATPKILPSETNETDEPASKRPRRASAIKALEHMESEDEDDDLDDGADAYAKAETDDSDKEDENYQEGPSTSMDDQPGPSGVGKGTTEASSELVISEPEADNRSDPNYKCGVCYSLFPTKDDFFGHHMSTCGKKFVCCKCLEAFKSLADLYEHSEKHKMEMDVEEIVLDYEGQLVTIPRQNLMDSNDLLYVLDDTQCINEVVIEEQAVESPQDEVAEAVKIVQLEHGYMLQNIEEYDKQCALKRIEKANKVNSPPKPRVNFLKKRHELPDFTSTSYVFISPNDEIDIPHYKCLRCEQLFINKFVFFRHIEKGKCYINNCDVCSATFAKNSEFYSHYVREHADRAICKFCFRTFMYEKNVKEHMLRHLDQFRHRCEQCNKGFYTVREYRNHYKNRHMGIRHKCNVCSRTFADEYYFRRHIATHKNSNNNIIVELDVTS